MRPRNRRYPPSPVPNGHSSTSMPWWMTADTGTVGAVAAWLCEIAMTADRLATVSKIRVVNPSKGPWCVTATGPEDRPTSGPLKVWSWMMSGRHVSRTS